MPDVLREDIVQRGRLAHLPGAVHDDAGERVSQSDNRIFYGTPYVHACLREFSDENGSRLPFSSHFSSIGAIEEFVKPAPRSGSKGGREPGRKLVRPRVTVKELIVHG